MSITFTVVSGPQVGRCFTFDRSDRFIIGRAPEAHFSLPEDDYFSRMHCLIEVNPPCCRLTDLNSRNGTLVNGVRVQTADLRHGDEVRGGMTALRVTVAADQPRETLDLPIGPARATEARAPEPVTATGMWDTVAPTEPLPLPAFPGYRLLGQLGAGGMGVVYRGERLSDGAVVAVKTIRADVQPGAPALARFLREASILAKLRHPSIVACLDVGAAGGLAYFVMELVEGTDAAALLSREGPFPVKWAVQLGLQMLAALDHAHRQGFVHRDVKPANVLVTREGSVERVKLADFGLARAYQESALSGVTMTGTAAGTPHYMPPEQMTDFRSAKPAADQYAAAATLYHLLTGRPVYEAKTAGDLFRKVLTEEPVPIASRQVALPPGLAGVIHKALARRAEQRFPDVRALAQALAVFA
jgi:serine/threonine-protein kinase